MDKLSIMGVRINNISMNEVLKLAEQKIKNDEKYIIYTPNTEIIMMCQKDEEFLNIMNKSNINVPDGVGLIYAGKIKKFPLKAVSYTHLQLLHLREVLQLHWQVQYLRLRCLPM